MDTGQIFIVSKVIVDNICFSTNASHNLFPWSNGNHVAFIFLGVFNLSVLGAAVMQWLSSWFAGQEVRGSIPGLAITISEIGYLLLLVTIWLKDRY